MKILRKTKVQQHNSFNRFIFVPANLNMLVEQKSPVHSATNHVIGWAPDQSFVVRIRRTNQPSKVSAPEFGQTLDRLCLRLFKAFILEDYIGEPAETEH